MNKLKTEKRTQIITALVEGNSIASVTRMHKINKRSVLRLLVDMGGLCRDLHDLDVQNVTCQRIQIDEIWSFCHAKEHNLTSRYKGTYGYGDVWTWVAIDADTKLCLSYLVGLRDGGYATEFLRDVADRLVNRVQLTSDGHNAYLDAVESAFGGEVDYAQLVKIYGKEKEQVKETRYSPAKCIGCRPRAVQGYPDISHVSTSYVERQNLTMRMSIRRFTRLTNAFSKKIENHEHAIALHFFYYNFCRKHKTLGTTPAFAAGITQKTWTVSDLVEVLEKEEDRFGGGRLKY